MNFGRYCLLCQVPEISKFNISFSILFFLIKRSVNCYIFLKVNVFMGRYCLVCQVPEISKFNIIVSILVFLLKRSINCYIFLKVNVLMGRYCADAGSCTPFLRSLPCSWSAMQRQQSKLSSIISTTSPGPVSMPRQSLKVSYLYASMFTVLFFFFFFFFFEKSMFEIVYRKMFKRISRCEY